MSYDHLGNNKGKEREEEFESKRPILKGVMMVMIMATMRMMIMTE